MLGERERKQRRQRRWYLRLNRSLVNVRASSAELHSMEVYWKCAFSMSNDGRVGFNTTLNHRHVTPTIHTPTTKFQRFVRNPKWVNRLIFSYFHLPSHWRSECAKSAERVLIIALPSRLSRFLGKCKWVSTSWCWHNHSHAKLSAGNAFGRHPSFHTRRRPRHHVIVANF